MGSIKSISNIFSPKEASAGGLVVLAAILSLAFTFRAAIGVSAQWGGEFSAVLSQHFAAIFAGLTAFLIVNLVLGWVTVNRLVDGLEEIRLREEKVLASARHDIMTGLVNRDRLVELLGEALEAQESGKCDYVVLAYFDIDNFKYINNTLGHGVGDELICQVARRCQEGLLPGDKIARMGGDEFVVLRCTSQAEAYSVSLGGQLMGLFDKPFDLDGRILEVTASCGVSWAPDQGTEPGKLLRNADIALFRAKQNGRARWRAYTPDMAEAVRQHHELAADLREAIAAGDLSLAYQPIVRAADDEIEGFEALLRWNHPMIGNIGPAVFIPVAEQSGKMIALGWWAMRQAFAECQAWSEYGISVNLSPLQMMASGFLQDLDALVCETGTDPRRVTFEITEGVLLANNTRVSSVLDGLRAMGFGIALDDFGTGYSSLGYLRQFRFDRLKIDRAFVRNIEDDADARTILEAIATMGHTLRMKIVAEGVETPRQRDLVVAAGCELIQGHYYWQAMPASEIDAMLAARQSQEALRKAS